LALRLLLRIMVHQNDREAKIHRTMRLSAGVVRVNSRARDGARDGARARDGEGLMPRSAVTGSCAAMLLAGAMTSFYGPLIPYLETRYGISRTTAGSVLGGAFGGALAGVLWAIWALRRLPDRTCLLAGLGAAVAGSGVLAAASAWWQVLAGAAIAGAGSGILDFGLNRVFTLAFSARRGAMLNVLNALYGAAPCSGRWSSPGSPGITCHGSSPEPRCSASPSGRR